MNKNIIYAYKKKSNNKIVYIGQTINLEYRHKQHMEWDPFNINNLEYNYPLSRGIRKYGEDEYELIILEEVDNKDLLNERERYWIKFYDTYFNGYNQTLGGSNPTKPIFTDDKIDIVIQMLLDDSYSYKDIMQKTGISMTHIYNINTGKRRKRDDLTYPLRSSNTKGTKGLKFSQEECYNIHLEILETKQTFKQIAKKYKCDAITIRRINQGISKSYHLDGFEYPLRKK